MWLSLLSSWRWISQGTNGNLFAICSGKESDEFLDAVDPPLPLDLSEITLFVLAVDFTEVRLVEFWRRSLSWLTMWACSPSYWKWLWPELTGDFGDFWNPGLVGVIWWSSTLLCRCNCLASIIDRLAGAFTLVCLFTGVTGFTAARGGGGGSFWWALGWMMLMFLC